MSNISIYDRVKQFSDSTGTGNFALGDTAQGFMPFSSALQDGEMFFYAINDNTRFEIGSGVYVATSDSFVRHCISNSNGDTNNVNFPAGRKEVFITYPASQAVTKTSFPDLAKSVDYSKTFTFPVPSFETATRTISFDWPEISGVNIASGYSLLHTVKNATFGGIVYQQMPHSIGMIHATLSENGSSRNVNFHFYNNENLVVGGGNALSDDDDTYGATTPFTLTVNVDVEFENYPSVVLSEEETTATTTTAAPVGPLGASSFTVGGETTYQTISKTYSLDSDFTSTSDGKVVSISIDSNIDNPNNDTLEIQAVSTSGGQVVSLGTLPQGVYSSGITFPLSNPGLSGSDAVKLRMVFSSDSASASSVQAFTSSVPNSDSAELALYHGGRDTFSSVITDPDDPDAPAYTEAPDYTGKQTLADFKSLSRLPASAAIGNIRQIACSQDGSYFVVNDQGHLFAWGNNSQGQLGLGHTNRVNFPTRVTTYYPITSNIRKAPNYASPQPLPAIKKVDSGIGKTAAIAENGKIFVWGGGGQTSTGSTTSFATISRPVDGGSVMLLPPGTVHYGVFAFASGLWRTIGASPTAVYDFRFIDVAVVGNEIHAIGDAYIDAQEPLEDYAGLYVRYLGHEPYQFRRFSFESTAAVGSSVSRVSSSSSSDIKASLDYDVAFLWYPNTEFNFSHLYSGGGKLYGVSSGRDFRANVDPSGLLDRGRLMGIVGENILTPPNLIDNTLENQVAVGPDFVAIILKDEQKVAYKGVLLDGDESRSQNNFFYIENMPSGVESIFASKTSNTLSVVVDNEVYVIGQNNGFISQTTDDISATTIAEIGNSPYDYVSNTPFSLGIFGSNNSPINLGMDDRNFFMGASKLVTQDLSNNGALASELDGEYLVYSKDENSTTQTNWGILEMVCSGVSTVNSNTYYQPSGLLYWGQDNSFI